MSQKLEVHEQVNLCVVTSHRMTVPDHKVDASTVLFETSLHRTCEKLFTVSLMAFRLKAMRMNGNTVHRAEQ